MEDEAKLREKVVVKKEKKLLREEEKKQSVINAAKRAALTSEQLKLVETSKTEEIVSKLDQQKLKEAQAIIT